MTAQDEYTVGTWHGMRQLRCTRCAWDTVEGEAAMQEHIRAVHTPKAPKEAPKVLLYDRFGNPLR